MLLVGATLAACSRKPSSKAGQGNQVMEGFALTLTDHGVTEWTLRSIRASFDAGADDVSLEEPRMEIFSATKGAQRSSSPTRVASRTGTYRQGSGDLRLQGSVVVDAEERGEKTVLKTESLDYSSEKSRFETDKPVFLTRGGSRMKGTGLTASKDLREIHVRHQQAVLE
ncbi:MAG: LPS export ABC transporter periplasmic protein LptC [Elusimicrobia bacterium]|nr:LPS export ABC transporter periplasmic protein LptC [Elusimicrobiota bacterium]